MSTISCRAHTNDAWWEEFNSHTPSLELYMRLIHPEGTKGPCYACSAKAYFEFEPDITSGGLT